MGSLHHWVGYLEPTWGLKWGKASISAINNKTEGQYGQMHTCVALRHNIDESKFSCYTNRYCVVCSNVLKGHHTIGQNKRVVNGPALGNINCRFLTVHQFSLFWMFLVSKNWWIGEIERNERKLRGQVEGREEKWKRAKLPPPVSLYTVLSLFFGWLSVWFSSLRINLCWISKFATGSKNSIFAWEVMILQFTIVYFYLTHRKNWTK